MDDIKTLPDFEDPRVQTAYEVLCSPDEPPEGEHWEGFSARRIVAALAEAHQAEVARLTRERDEAVKINTELLDQMHHFAKADQRLWDEGQRDSESFIRWVRSRAAHLLAKFTDRAALAGASGAAGEGAEQ